MDWVVDGIAIGGMSDAIDHSRLQEAGIEAVLQLYGAERERIGFPFPAEVLQLPVMDRGSLPPPLLRQGVEFIRRQRTQERKILVTCGAGISRSPTFVAAYLHEEGADLLEAYLRIIRVRPQTRPHRALLRSLVEQYQLSNSAEEQLMMLSRGRQRPDGSL